MEKTWSIRKIFDRHRLPPKAQWLLHCGLIYLRDTKRVDLTKQASGMAYVTLFSLVPSLAAIFTLLGLFLPILGDHGNLMDTARQFLFKNLATGSGTLVIEYLDRFIAGLNLKKIGMSAFVGLLVTLIILLRQIEEALNRIWMVHEARSMITRFVYFWLFLTLGMFAVSVLIGLTTSYSVTTLITKRTLAAADRADDIPVIAILFNWAFSCGIFYLAYKVIPNCNVRNNAARWGAVLAGTLFYVLGKFYTVYVTNFASYKNIYGTLAALPVFLMWIYVCWIILLAGALFAWRWQTGWPPPEEEKSIEHADTPIDRHRNLLIKSLLPQIFMIYLYERFQKGQPVTAQLASSEIRVPYEWISETTGLLMDLNFVAKTLVKDSAGKDQEQILPLCPAERVKISSLVDKTEQSADAWLNDWEPEASEALKRFAGHMRDSRWNLADQTIGDFI